MKNIFEAPFVVGMCKATANMYRMGWDERNGGNISVMLENDEVAEYLDINAPIRSFDMGFDASVLAGKIFIVTGTGKYFKNVEDDPENNLGIIKIAENGTTAEVLWGYKDGGRPTSELPAHLMSHISRLSKNPENRVIIEDGVAKLPDRSSFAGSIATAATLLEKGVNHYGFSIADTVKMITETPASILGLFDRGVIKNGYRADIVVFDKELKINNVFIGGKEYA